MRREFELSNHLGNVLVTLSDKKLQVQNGTTGVVGYYNADVITATDYYPFGMTMPGRKYSQPNSNYRYGFNGKENDKDISEGVQDYGMRIYDTRLVKFLSVDPLTKDYPELTPYQFASNTPIQAIDLDGGESKYYDVNISFGKKALQLELFNYKLVKESGLKISTSAFGAPRISYVNRGPRGTGILYTIHYSFHFDVPNGDGIENGVAELYVPSDKDDKKRGGLYMYTKNGGAYQEGSGAKGESDEPAIEIGLLLGAMGGIGKGEFELGEGLFRIPKILENIQKLLEGTMSINDIRKELEKMRSENEKNNSKQSPTNTPTNDNLTPRIEPGEKPKSVNFYYLDPGQKHREPAPNEKGTGSGLRTTPLESGRPDTNLFIKRKKH